MSTALRVWLSRMADPAARRAAGLWLLGGCVVGFLISVTALAARGAGDRWSFAFLVWAALVFIPLRILIESAGTMAAGARRALAARLAADPARFTHPSYLPIAIDVLAERAVTLPRVCRPPQRRQAVEAAVAILLRANASPESRVAVVTAIRRLLAAISHEVAALSVAASGPKAAAIQARWEGARGVGTMAALVAVMIAVFRDRWGDTPQLAEMEGRSIDEYVSAVLDYCDEAALQVDAIPWTEPPLATGTAPAAIAAIWEAWNAFLAAGLPAPRALDGFVSALAAEHASPGRRPGT